MRLNAWSTLCCNSALLDLAHPLSAILLVHKKDGSYRFCVGYRYLNAITIKSKFPSPIFDQLIDELAGASWFSTLDLIARYHQVRLQPGEEFKTTFQKHA
jgi:hypothetical protein